MQLTPTYTLFRNLFYHRITVSLRPVWRLPQLVIFLMWIALRGHAQIPQCGFDPLKNPQIRQALNARLAATQTTYDNTTVYTLPVVVHVYHLGEAEGTGNNVSMAFVNQVIQDLNDGFRAQGVFSGQRDTRIQFELAKRSPTCQPTNGVVRVNASTVPNYTNEGIWVGDAPMIDALRTLSSWPEDYINIRLVKSPYSQAWAYFLNDMFFPISWPWPGRRGAMVHEMGHILTLNHTFEGENNNAQCPPNTDPDNQGDLVADTDPHKTNDNCYDNADTDINPCTARPFGRILHNFMSYSCYEEFTSGQIQRMRLALVNSRPEWLNSQALVTPSVIPPLPATACNVVSVNGRSFLYGFEKFHFGSLQVGASPPDYTGKTHTDRTCLQRISIPAGQPQTVYLRSYYQTGIRFRIYIDYNNNGVFDLPGEEVAGTGNWATELTTTITPPLNAVTNVPLRMRVVGDREPSTPCQVTGDVTWKAGNAEDFTVTVTGCQPPAVPTASVTTQPTCTMPTGTITVTAPTGANLEYSVNGSTYQASTTFAGLNPGNYSVTVRNTTTNCISNSLSLMVNSVPNAPATPTASVTVQPTCTTPTGTIVVTAPTGANLEYSIGGTYQSSTTFAGLLSDNYTVTVRNTTTGCVSNDLSLVVTNPIPPSPPTLQITCAAPTGSIAVTAPTGANLQYSLNNGPYQSSTSFLNLSAGNYAVTVKNTVTNCVSNSSGAVINQAPTATISGSTTVVQGAPSPNITFTGNAGMPPYTFTYTLNGGSNQTVTTTGMSNTVTVAVSTAFIQTYIYNLVSVQTSTCSQTQTGAATVTVNPPAGGTTITVSGAIAFPLTNSTYTLNNSGSFQYTPIQVKDAGTDAYFDAASIVGSRGQYQIFRNSGTWKIGRVICNGCTTPGTDIYYTLSSNTAKPPCTGWANGVVLAGDCVTPISLSATIVGSTAVCQNAPVPNITFSGSGGTNPYTFTYNINGSGNQTITTTGSNTTVTVAAPTNNAGTFTYNLVSIQDATTTQSVTGSAVVTVNSLPATPAASVTIQPSCATPTGAIVVTAPTGANLQYSINGSTYQASTTFAGLNPGNYSLTVRNTTTNCTSNALALTVNGIPNAPATPTASVTVQPSCTTPTGTILVTAPTGANLEYSINGSTYQASTTFAGLSPTMYSVTVKNTTTGCTSTALSLIVNIPPSTGVGGTVSTNQVICPNTSPANLNLSGQVGNVVKWQRADNIGFSAPTDINHTGTVLTGATIGPLSATTYFRAVVQSPGCNQAFSSSVTIMVQNAGPPVTLTSPTDDVAPLNNRSISASTISASNIINATAGANYTATNAVVLTPNFEAKRGSTFVAQIGGCNP